MEAAESLFSRWGYARVSISQILEASDLRAPSLYHHYGGKERLYAVWAHQSLARLGSRLGAISGLGEERAAAKIVEVLSAEGEVNLLQLSSEMDLFEEADTASHLRESIESSVVEPTRRILQEAGLKSSRDCAVLLIQMAMMLRPGYRTLSQGLSSDCVAHVVSLGLRPEPRGAAMSESGGEA